MPVDDMYLQYHFKAKLNYEERGKTIFLSILKSMPSYHVVKILRVPALTRCPRLAYLPACTTLFT
jgi:hypothetical protein